MRTTPEPRIEWPKGFSPAECAVHVVNQLECARGPDYVWRKLIRAAAWPDFYANAQNVRIVGGGEDLAEGTSFTWRTFGVSLRTDVVAFEPRKRITWIARATGLTACHAWLLSPTPSGGCHILTEETQKGFVARLGVIMFPGRMERQHQIWLEGLAA